MTDEDFSDPRRLYDAMLQAARAFPSRPHKGALGGPYVSNYDPAGWNDEKYEAVRLQVPSGAIFHLDFAIERRGKTDERRMKIRGRRVVSFDEQIHPTQRATFNSETRDAHGYLLKPQQLRKIAPTLNARLPGPALPRMEGNGIRLGLGTPYELLRRFLIALAALEDAKGKRAPQPLPFTPGPAKDLPVFTSADLDYLALIDEGERRKNNGSRRHRCARLRDDAREHFRGLSDDGRLHCSVCNWVPEAPTRSEIVQIHHCRPVGGYPEGGLRMRLSEALKHLAPLCPNCHRVLESHPGGGHYTLQELRALRAGVVRRSS